MHTANTARRGFCRQRVSLGTSLAPGKAANRRGFRKDRRSPLPTVLKTSSLASGGGEKPRRSPLPSVDSGNASLILVGTIIGLVGAFSVAGVGDHVDRIVRTITVFSLVGTAVAYRRSQRLPETDPFPIITRWSFVGLAFGITWEGGVLLFAP